MSNKKLMLERRAIKARRHSNNKGDRQIRNGKTREQVRQLAEFYSMPYKVWRQGFNHRTGV